MTADTVRVLVVDDEPDVAAVTRLSLRGMRHGGRPVELVTATTGAGAVAAMRADPGIAVILLDVVMETDAAGLDACRAIREELGNRYVRILLRTGQPGAAPERATIDDYDIDGYLPKAELTTNRLYAAVRTALKAFEELVDLDRHHRVLALLNDTAVSLHPYEPFEVMLQRILGAAATLVPSTPLAVVGLHVRPPGAPLPAQGAARAQPPAEGAARAQPPAQGAARAQPPAQGAARAQARDWLLHLSTSAAGDAADAASAAAAASGRVEAHLATLDEPEAGTAAGGYLVPFTLHQGLGEGWLYVDGVVADPLARSALPLLAAHAANALYSAAILPEPRVQQPVIMETGRQ